MILSAVCAAIASYYFVESSQPTPHLQSENLPSPGIQAPVERAIQKDQHTYYLFDVHGHSAEEVAALLNRAKDTFDQLSSDLQATARIAMVLHGPDVAFFSSENYDQYKSLVDLAAEVDAFGFLDIKVCTASARSRGLDADKFPPFIELVPYGPVKIRRLESAGYVQL